jgi:hypothetical protein
MRSRLIKGWKRGNQGKVVSWKVESPDEPQENLIKGGRGISFKWSRQEI